MSGLTWSARLVVLLPAFAALAGGLVPRTARWASAVLGVAGAAGALVAALGELALTASGRAITGIALLGPVPTGAGRVTLDLPADQVRGVVAVMGGGGALCGQGYPRAPPGGAPRFRGYAWTVFLFPGPMGAVGPGGHPLVAANGWEVMGLCSYLLVGHD